ncbi:hypothetical protein HYU23_02050 [Candidatus Woesearchaeota archaeon]|nr:hypothetical protein [Candidatus Woesearchaeota archaeon]
MSLTLEIGLQDNKPAIKSYKTELSQYLSDLTHPLEVLEISHRRKELTDILLDLTETTQLSLLCDESETLDHLFDGLLQLRKEKRPLYKRFQKEINGKTRDLAVPQKPLDLFLRNYAGPIINQAECHAQAHGGENNWSLTESIKTHLPIGIALSFDLSQAFKNTHLQYVFDFYYSLIYKKTRDKKTSTDLAGFLATVSTVYYRDGGYALPQGSNIATKLFNRLLYPIDESLSNYAKNRNLTYTRWIDDFILASKDRDKTNKELIEATNIVQPYFPLSEKKTFLQRDKPVYLLGQKIVDCWITKATTKEIQSKNPMKSTTHYL